MCNSGIICEVKPIENIISFSSVLFDSLYTVKLESNVFRGWGGFWPAEHLEHF